MLTRRILFAVERVFKPHSIAMSSSSTSKTSKKRYSREEKRLHQQQIGGEKQKPKLEKKPAWTFPEKLLDYGAKAAATQGVVLKTLQESDGDVRVITSTSSDMFTVEESSAASNVIVVKPLLILDLNGILCHRIRKGREDLYPNVPFRKAVDHIANTPVVPRVHGDHFLNYLDANFCLAVWTSAKPKTAKLLLKVLFPEPIRERLLFVWSQNHCLSVPGDGETIFVKPLSKVWYKHPLWNPSNTFLMDDSPEKCPDQNNTLHPPPMHGKQLSAAVPMSDEENGEHQMRFFSHVVQHFMEPRETWPSKDSEAALAEFLNRSARSHMGWRGPDDSPE